MQYTCKGCNEIDYSIMSTATITAGGAEFIDQTATLYASAFANDPVQTYILNALPAPRRKIYLHEYFTRLLTAAALNAAIFSSTDEGSAYAVVIPPGYQVDNPWTMLRAGILSVLWNLGAKGCWKMLGEFEPLTLAAKTKGLKGAGVKHYYVFFVATAEEHRGKGLSSALIQQTQAKASAEGMPVWLEATTEYSARLYKRLGFEKIEKIVLGKGTADGDGLPMKGGEGVPVWGMVWWPNKPTAL